MPIDIHIKFLKICYPLLNLCILFWKRYIKPMNLITYNGVFVVSFCSIDQFIRFVSLCLFFKIMRKDNQAYVHGVFVFTAICISNKYNFQYNYKSIIMQFQSVLSVSLKFRSVGAAGSGFLYGGGWHLLLSETGMPYAFFPFHMADRTHGQLCFLFSNSAEHFH